MKTTLNEDNTRSVVASLQSANAEFAKIFPGEPGHRQPVHTVYGGAHLFKAQTAQRLGKLGLRALETYAPNFVDFARAIGLPGHGRLPTSMQRIEVLESTLEDDPEEIRGVDEQAWLAWTIHRRVRRKLETEPVEDFRIDFEDGFGNRPDDEEDETAVRAAQETAKGMQEQALPPFIGIRIKPFSGELYRRSLRTLDIYLNALLDASDNVLPDNFVVTLPKVTIPEQVNALVRVFELLEQDRGLPAGSLKLEVMIETTQSLFDAEGRFNLPLLLRAAEGRCVAAHFGTYDYTASCNITAAHQHMTHPACDFARELMKIAFAGTGIWLSDGATNIMPVGPHRAQEGEELSPFQVRENMEVVHNAWRLHYEHIQHSLINAYYQGWDLHPAQLPTRYAAVYSFFLRGLGQATERLSNFIEQAAQATLVGDVFDDAATGQGLLNFFLRGVNCGAITEEEALATGVTLEELRGRSFVKILENRRKI